MGLKGHMLWAMGQMNATCRAPPHERRDDERARIRLVVALQVEI
jgi:hypothetical protein